MMIAFVNLLNIQNDTVARTGLGTISMEGRGSIFSTRLWYCRSIDTCVKALI